MRKRREERGERKEERERDKGGRGEMSMWASHFCLKSGFAVPSYVYLIFMFLLHV